MKDMARSIERLQKLVEYINNGSTGPARILAVNLKLSVRAFHSLKGELQVLLKPYGVRVTYSTAEKSYVYTRPGNFWLEMGWKN